MLITRFRDRFIFILGNIYERDLSICQVGRLSLNDFFLNVTSTADSQSIISNSTLCNQHISAKSVDGEDPPDVRGQQLKQGMQCGQLSVASNSNGFHEEMGSKEMSDHL